MTRKTISSNLLDQLYRLLNDYYESGYLEENGIPTIKEISNKLLVSQRYLSDALKKETGKSTLEHIQLFLVNKAKTRLIEKEKTASEIAYELGFEYPQYFSRLFKKQTDKSPIKYRKEHKLN